ncbi:dGTP triphosphohydrolase [Pseudoxanthomonas mexicana]|uniref:dGTP triphosphohydrolase n=1 Tax=Pseudoxanthomonas mexicana TaxID=128785 RepID=UPI001FD6F1F0|nr:dNTP triphosphohydrolase [Pseudoxanthomonas mexicana]UOV02813.1 dNTP triphosphohydrolase [Pseudoxanthomonas mexicana]
MLDWKKLLSPNRRKHAAVGTGISLNVAVGREETERDYDRILFSAPTRRLADKTQVFPMEENDSVRTRLTHSHEVSNLARSIGIRLAFEHADEVFGPDHNDLKVNRTVPALLGAIGLAHDLGNPPFGHQGEASMQQWFVAKARSIAAARHVGSGDRQDTESFDPSKYVEADFLNFDGNAQTLRLLTRLQVLNDDYGLNLTVATLSALIKYPAVFGAEDHGYKKAGVFRSEEAIADEVWAATGLTAGVRHPLAVVMEACDDIAYSVIDAEDTIKKGYASFYDLMDFIDSGTTDAVSKEIVKKARLKNQEFRKENLSSRELDDISMQIFRALAISRMVDAATKTFVANKERLMSGESLPNFELIKESECAAFCKVVKTFDARYGFQHRDVLRLELQGHNYIQSMMDMLWSAVQEGADSTSPFDRFVYGSISENYRRVFELTDRGDYAKRQIICDALAGMTESFLIKKHDELSSLAKAG